MNPYELIPDTTDILSIKTESDEPGNAGIYRTQS